VEEDKDFAAIDLNLEIGDLGAEQLGANIKLEVAEDGTAYCTA
jgi:hypothetical protein